MLNNKVPFSISFATGLALQLLPHQHSGPDHPGLRWKGNSDVRPWRRARTHAEAPRPGQQVRSEPSELWPFPCQSCSDDTRATFHRVLPLAAALISTSRTPWKRCCFSGDGEYIVAGSARQHALYIWEKSIGNLVKILHGTRGELLLDVAVRTCRVLCCCTFWQSCDLTFLQCAVASRAPHHRLHLKWSGVHLGPKPSG